ncbi:MAG: MotA/TolQ/ExbB proton channel family protein [Pseudomonadota bacterium]
MAAVTVPALAPQEPFWSSLLDPGALAIVLVGTLLATSARAGWRDLALALSALSDLARQGFDADANRTALARWARSMRDRGLLGADEPLPPDTALARALDAMVRTGTLAAFQSVYEAARARQSRRAKRAAQVLEQAGDLAPVFGLVGTLFALTQIAPDAAAQSALDGASALGAIATAVLSSLYGVLTAHLVFLPLAHAIARRAEREDAERAELAEWLVGEAADDLPGRFTPLKPAA